MTASESSEEPTVPDSSPSVSPSFEPSAPVSMEKTTAIDAEPGDALAFDPQTTSGEPDPGLFSGVPAPASPYGLQTNTGQPVYGGLGVRPAHLQTPAGSIGPEPSNATAIIAGVLAALGAIHMLFGLFGGVWTMVILVLDGQITTSIYQAVAIVFLVIALVTLVWGAILLFRRRPKGRVLVSIGSGAVIVSGVMSYLAMVLVTHAVATPIGGGLLSLIALIFPVITLVLVLIPPTKRWLESAPVEVSAMGVAMPAQPGYGHAPEPHMQVPQNSVPQNTMYQNPMPQNLTPPYQQQPPYPQPPYGGPMSPPPGA